MRPGTSVVRAHRAVAFPLLLSLTASSGCVWSQHERAVEARGRYHACLEEHAADPEACELLREEAIREYEEYEDEAREKCHGRCDETWSW